MRRRCDTCGSTYEAKRSTSKYCSKKCNVRATRTRGKLVLVGASTPDPPATTTPDEGDSTAPDVLGALITSTTGPLAATHKDLEQAGCLDSPLGQVALQLAARIQFVPETGAGTAALSRELRAVLEAAKAAAAPTGDRFDEISERRQNKANSAT
jgi:hypothetical protein